VKFKSEREASLMEIVKEELGYSSNTKARNVIKTGQIMVDGKLCKIPSTTISEKSTIELIKSSNKSKRSLEEPVLLHKIVFEDENLLVVDKRVGLITKSGNRNLKTLFFDVFKYFRSKGIDTCLLVNSVDRKESGLVLFAKDLKLYKDLSENWKDYVKRHYVVIPGGMVDEKGSLEDTFHVNDIGLLLPGKGKHTKEVELTYRVMKSNGEFSVIRVEEISQHKNQIRAIFSQLGNPILGDSKYRSEFEFGKGMASHFFSISIDYKGGTLDLKTPVPKQFLKLAR